MMVHSGLTIETPVATTTSRLTAVTTTKLSYELHRHIMKPKGMPGGGSLKRRR